MFPCSSFFFVSFKLRPSGQRGRESSLLQDMLDTGRRTPTTAETVGVQPKIEVFDKIFTLPLFHHNAISMGTHLLDVSGKSFAEGAVEVRLGRRTQLGSPQENAFVLANLCRRPQIGGREKI